MWSTLRIITVLLALISTTPAHAEPETRTVALGQSLLPGDRGWTIAGCHPTSKELSMLFVSGATGENSRILRLAEGDWFAVYKYKKGKTFRAKLVKFGPGCNGVFEIHDPL